MAACYNDRIAGWSSDMMAGNRYPVYTTWAVNLLLKWHRQDPVSSKEIERNEAVYAHQHNRNPFIDHPDMAEHIWGEYKDTGWSSSGVARPSIASPADGSAIDLGKCGTGIERIHIVTVKGQNLTTIARHPRAHRLAHLSSPRARRVLRSHSVPRPSTDSPRSRLSM